MSDDAVDAEEVLATEVEALTDPGDDLDAPDDAGAAADADATDEAGVTDEADAAVEAGVADDAEVADEPGVADGAEAPTNGSPTAPTATAVLEYLARTLVAHPDEVRVEVDDSERLTLNIYVADGDMGRVIGKRGRVANAMRAVGRAAAAKDGEQGVSIEFVD